MLMRPDSFRQLERLTQPLLGGNGTKTRPTVMPMDAWREDDTFHIQFDLPGLKTSNIDLDVERNVVTVQAERPKLDDDVDRLASERPRGTFSRQVVLGDELDPDRISAHYADGVLSLEIPVVESAKPRKIEVGSGDAQQSISS